MKIVIIEDEPLAVEKIERYLEKITKEIEVVEKLDSIAKSIPWIAQHQDEVDVFFMDIQLMDGLSFDIFSQVNVTKPVIFITAFDEYAIDAFRVNSIDYLLKPVTFTALSRSLQKFESMKHQFQNSADLLSVVGKLKNKGYKNRFLVKKGNHIQSILTKEVACFYAEGRDVYLVHQEGKRYLIEYRLERLVDFVDARSFFRINRSTLVNIDAIRDVVVHSNRRLKLVLRGDLDANFVISREKVADFKKWFEGL
jgi:DNA-binding LytR/AlgR family response regulator